MKVNVLLVALDLMSKAQDLIGMAELDKASVDLLTRRLDLARDTAFRIVDGETVSPNV